MSEPTRHSSTPSRDSGVSFSDSSRFVWPFELLEKIGEGGMGVVYKAKMAQKGIIVALKLLPDDITDEIVRARFERETELLKSLRHPNIVRAFGGKCDNNRPFYAMELITGGSLDDKIRRSGQLEWQTAVMYAQQICDALAYAHNLGIVHRDIKPANFLMTEAGQVKLTDFGLASVVSGRKLTRTGRTMGTIDYMAPEQIRGKPPVSAQTDLYALGCVMFEMLTGKTPFEGENSANVMQAHLREVPPKVTQINSLCPAGLAEIIDELLVKDPEDRPESAKVVRKKLDELLESPIHHMHTRVMATADSARSSSKSRHASEDQSPTPAWMVPTLVTSIVLNAALLSTMYFRPLATPGYDQMLQTLQQHPSVEVRDAMAVELAEAVKRNDAIIDQMLMVFETEETPGVKAQILRSIGAAGSQGKRYWPLLQKIANEDPNEQVRSAAMQTVSKLKEG